MAYKNELRSYKLTPQQKASMIMVLSQFSICMETVHEIKNILMVQGDVVIGSHYAVLLARIIHPYFPAYSEQLLRPLKPTATMTAEDHARVWGELVELLS